MRIQYAAVPTLPLLLGVSCAHPSAVPARALSPAVAAQCSTQTTAVDTSRVYDERELDQPLQFPAARPALPAPAGPGAPAVTRVAYIIDVAGRIEPCSIRVLEENDRSWTTTVLARLLQWQYAPGRKAGTPVRVAIHEQTFRAQSTGS